MTKNELEAMFDAVSPTELQRERMLRNILTEKGERSQMKTESTAKRAPLGLRFAAAVLALCLVSALCVQLFGASPLTLSVCALDSGQSLTEGAWISGGHVNDDGSSDGGLFYLAGEDISTIRFTTQNQYLTFKDWSDQRPQVWRSQDFTVDYGPNEEDYDKLVLYWDCYDALMALDDPDTNVTDLPDHLRHDTITMTATYEDGRTLTQAINVDIQDNGELTLTLAG